MSADGVFSFGDTTPDGNAYNTLGTANAGGTNIGDGSDLYITDSLEIDGTFYLGADGITDITGSGLEVSGTSLQVNLDSAGADGSTTSSVSGLEFDTGELSLLRGCASGGVLKWDDTNFEWDCGTDAGSGAAYWELSSNTLSPGGDAADTDRLAIGGPNTTVFQFEVNGTQTGKALVVLGYWN